MEPYLPTDFSEKQDMWNHWMAQQASTLEKNEKERLARQIRDHEDDEELQLVLEDYYVWYGKRDSWIHMFSCFN